MLAISYATLNHKDNMKKLSILAAIVFAMAFTSAAMAQQVNNPVAGFLFSGNVARSDHNIAWVTLAGPYTNPSVSDPLYIHFVDGYSDYSCNVDSPYGLQTTHNAGNQSGQITVTPSNCVNNRTGTAITATGTMTFIWSWADQNGSTWNIIAKYINVMFPATPVCLYDSFSGIGTIVDP